MNGMNANRIEPPMEMNPIGGSDNTTTVLIMNGNPGQEQSRFSDTNGVARKLELSDDEEPPHEATWASLFTQNCTNGMSLKYIPPILVERRPVAQLDITEVEINTAKWRNYLIVFVIGENPPFSYTDTYIAKNWNQVKKT